MKIVSVCLENNSRHISTTGMHKYRTNLLCTVTPNNFGFSNGTFFLLMFRRMDFFLVFTFL